MGRVLNFVIVLILIVFFSTDIIKNYYSVEAFNEISTGKINNNNNIDIEITLKPSQYEVGDSDLVKRHISTAILQASEITAITTLTNNTAAVLETTSAADTKAAGTIAAASEVAEISAGETKGTSSETIEVSNIVYYSGINDKKQLALTFDDGPDEYYTIRILDILKQYNVKATFFVIGKNAEMHPNILKRIEYEGHIIGNHTYNHVDLNKLNEEQIRFELSKTEAVLDSTLGHHTKLMRPPFGNNSKDTIKAVSNLGYKIVDWSVDTKDWSGVTPAKIMEYVEGEVHPGAIILHHSANRVNNTLEALPKEIEKLRSEGYEFVTIPELLGSF